MHAQRLLDVSMGVAVWANERGCEVISGGANAGDDRRAAEIWRVKHCWGGRSAFLTDSSLPQKLRKAEPPPSSSKLSESQLHWGIGKVVFRACPS